MVSLTASTNRGILHLLPEQTGSGARRRDSHERKGNQKPCETWKPEAANGPLGSVFFRPTRAPGLAGQLARLNDQLRTEFRVDLRGQVKVPAGQTAFAVSDQPQRHFVVVDRDVRVMAA